MKDTNNLLTHNQWSATEYLKSKEGFIVYNSSNVSRENTNSWCVIGETSLKITNLKSTSPWVKAGCDQSFVSKTVTGSITVNAKFPVQIYLIEQKDGVYINYTHVNVPKDTVTDVNLSLSTGMDNDSVKIQILVQGDIGAFCYVDDISLVSN